VSSKLCEEIPKALSQVPVLRLFIRHNPLGAEQLQGL
jgi:hypothetical protein